MNTLFRRLIVVLLVAISVCTYAGKPIFLITPIQRAPAIIYAGETANASYQITNNTPFPLNNNGLIKVPLGLTQTVTQGSCTNPFSLPAGASCTLNLLITADNLNGNLTGGPFICNTMVNPIYCSKPATINELNVIKSPNPPPVTNANLNLTPTSVSFIVNTNSTPITLQNISTSVTATGIVLNPSVNLSLVNNTCGPTLAPQAFCTFQVTSPTVSTGNTVSIRGNNTNLVILTASVTAVPQATLGVTPNTLSFEVGGAANTVTLNNLSTVNAENLQLTIPAISQITLDMGNTTCTTTLAANSSCGYSFLPGSQTETNTVITVNGTNTNIVTITVDVSEVVINLAPSPLNFEVGSSGTLTVTNQSTTTAVNNLQVMNPSTDINIDTGSSTCTIGGTIAASGSCTFVFTASTAASTTVTIQGDNTNAANDTINAALPPATTINIVSPTTVQVLNADGVINPFFITVQNTGAQNAINIIASSPWTGVSITPTSGCANLAPGSSNCTFAINTSTPNIAGQITIQGENTGAVLTPYVAFRYQGGLVFSVTGASPTGLAKMINEVDLGGSQPWDTLISSGTTGANSLTDGGANTTIIVNLYGVGSYAASTCDTFSSGIFNDWYLPAICEYGVASSVGGDPGCGTSIPNIFTNLYLLGFGNFTDGGFYWSSTEAAAFFAWIQLFNNTGGGQFANGKANTHLVRCAREAIF